MVSSCTILTVHRVLYQLYITVWKGAITVEKLNTEGSKALFAKTKMYLVEGVASSFHKAADEEYPLCLERGKGSKVYDVDGNEYIDYIGGFGPMLLGYSPEAVNRAVVAQIERGSQLSATTVSLCQLAKKLTEIIPCAERVSFQNSGTEANMHAFRLARAYTGKKKIIKFEGQYHGWADEEKISIDAANVKELGERQAPARLFTTRGQRRETADDIIILPWNDLELLEQVIEQEAGELAAVITEPIMCDSGPILPKPGYLAGLRDLTSHYQVVLIFDEVITGFRVALGGAQQYYGVTPDLAVFAKAIAGGYPLAAIAGKREIMEAGVPAAGTFNANAIAVAASLATIGVLETEQVYPRLEQLGGLFVQGMRTLGETYGIPLFCQAVGSICILMFGLKNGVDDFRHYLTAADIAYYDLFVRKARQYGVRFTARRGRIYLSTEHSEADISRTLQVAERIFAETKNRRVK